MKKRTSKKRKTVISKLGKELAVGRCSDNVVHISEKPRGGTTLCVTTKFDAFDLEMKETELICMLCLRIRNHILNPTCSDCGQSCGKTVN